MSDQNFSLIASTIIAYVKNFKDTEEEMHLHVEDTIRKVAHVEYMKGYIECKREEDERHLDLRGKLIEAKEKIARNLTVWSDK